jgi:hypothetical protein
MRTLGEKAGVDAFSLIYVTASIVLALAALRVLVALAAALRLRHSEAWDWAPVAWAAAVLLQLGVFWWHLREIHGIATAWTSVGLVVLVASLTALVLAALLVLPLNGPSEGRTLRDTFDERGRTAVAALAAFHVVALLANREIYDEGLLTESGHVDLVLAIIAVAAFLGGRRVPMAAALGYVVVLGWSTFGVSPFAA